MFEKLRRGLGGSRGSLAAHYEGGPNRATRRQRSQRPFVANRTEHRRVHGVVVPGTADRWEWKPTQVPPQKRREANRRRSAIAAASRKASR